MVKVNKQNIPNFYILGAAKSGTTSIYKYLSKHPKIYFPENKEPQFFCNEELYSKGLDDYIRTHYKDCEDYLLRGDASPQYLFYEKAAQRISEASQEVDPKFIVILRDPVARAYSLYKNMCYEGYEELSFEQALESETDRLSDGDMDRLGTLRYAYRKSGLYAKQLKAYFRHFNKSQFHIVFYEDLVAQPEVVVEGICKFLRLKNIAMESGKKYNSAAEPRYRWLQNIFRKPNHVRRLMGKFLPTRLKSRMVTSVLSLNKKSVSYEPMNIETEQMLRRSFLEDIEEVEKITAKKLTHWKLIDSKAKSYE